MRKLEDLNFYELLDLEPGAGPAEIRHAFNVAMQTYRTGSLAVYSVLSEEERELLISRIKQAYAVLLDEGRRSRYDKQLHLTGNAAQAALQSATGSTAEFHQESTNSIWSKVRHVLPAHEVMGATVSKLLKPRGARKADSELSISSGHYLKSVRKLKGISLEEISEKTKIKIRYLEALEQEDYESLPAGVYQRYILKALAQAIDLDPEAVANDFQRRFLG